MAPADPGPTADEEPPRRPRVHFTPPYGWLNDPNGLVHADGVYHLCYQHHPDDLLWGPMHWGHATSRDLVRWEHQPIALVPDHLGAAFSGSAVVDREGVAGFGEGALVAFYTHFLEGVPQSQGVAFSTDGGTTWRPYDHNPVVSAPPGVVDFRDPKVLRLSGVADEPWVMVLVAGQEVVFYRSADLLAWEPAGSFGEGYGAHGGVWETPDLFELPVEGTAERRWVLTVSVQEGGPAGGSGTQYFVGRFDGRTFTSDDPPDVVRWVDHGADFYAPQSWSDTPQGRRVWLAWMSNWRYARETPASGWRGAMTVPRDLGLVVRGGRPVLAQRPVPELDGRGRELTGGEHRTVPAGAAWVLAEDATAVDVRLTVASRLQGTVAVELRRGSGVSRVVYDGPRRTLRVEPSDWGLPDRCRDASQEVTVEPPGEELDLRVVVDTTSVEVFTDGGTVVVTNQVFGAAEVTVALVAGEADVALSAVRVRDLSDEVVEAVSQTPRHGEGAPG